MPIQKAGKTYYTQEEVDKRMDEYLQKSADELIHELRKQWKKDKNKEVNYV